MKNETVFLNGNGFLVTNTRFEVPGQTYVMGGVTSVKITKTVPSKRQPIMLILFGSFFFLAANAVAIIHSEALVTIYSCCGLILLLFGWLALRSKKTVYHLVLTTAGGEQKATSSTNAKFMESLRIALTNAIIHRG